MSCLLWAEHDVEWTTKTAKTTSTSTATSGAAAAAAAVSATLPALLTAAAATCDSRSIKVEGISCGQKGGWGKLWQGAKGVNTLVNYTV